MTEKNAFQAALFYFFCMHVRCSTGGIKKNRHERCDPHLRDISTVLQKLQRFGAETCKDFVPQELSISVIGPTP